MTMLHDGSMLSPVRNTCHPSVPWLC